MERVDALTKSALAGINKQFSSGAIRDEAELDYVVFKVLNTRGVNQKAGVLLMEIARKHPFVDGNKRTAFESAATLLRLNGKKLTSGENSRFNVVFWAVRQKTTLDEIVQWIANHTR